MKLLKDLWFMLTTPLCDQFYCFGCEDHIHRNDRAAHEARGHKVMFHDEQYYADYERYSR